MIEHLKTINNKDKHLPSKLIITLIESPCVVYTQRTTIKYFMFNCYINKITHRLNLMSW